MSLALSYFDLQSLVGIHAGFGSNPDNDTAPWDAEKLYAVDAAINDGYRMFLFPTPVIQGQSHSWSFLRPVFSMSTVSGIEVYQLPEDFGHSAGDITIVSTSTAYDPIAIVGDGYMRGNRTGNPTASGVPTTASTRCLTGGGGPQRWEIEFYPSPDAVYALEFPYTVGNPQKLSKTNPYPYGGAMHADTLKAACLAAWERSFDDEQGVQMADFQRRLAASMAVDARSRGDFLGRYRDESGPTSRTGTGRARHGGTFTVTVGGVEYD